MCRLKYCCIQNCKVSIRDMILGATGRYVDNNDDWQEPSFSTDRRVFYTSAPQIDSQHIFSQSWSWTCAADVLLHKQTVVSLITVTCGWFRQVAPRSAFHFGASRCPTVSLRTMWQIKFDWPTFHFHQTTFLHKCLGWVTDLLGV